MGNSEPLNYNYLRKNFPELAEDYDSTYTKQNIPKFKNNSDRYLGFFDRYDSWIDPLWRAGLTYDRRGNLKGNGLLNQIYFLANDTTQVPFSHAEQRARDYIDARQRQKINFADYISSLREGARNLSPEELNTYRTSPLTGASDDDYKKRYNMLTKVLGMDKSTVLNPEMQKTIDTAEASKAPPTVPPPTALSRSGKLSSPACCSSELQESGPSPANLLKLEVFIMVKLLYLVC